MEDLDESHPALGQPSGRQELLAERAGDVVVEAVEPARGGRPHRSSRSSSGTAVCIRKASSYDWIRARSLASSGYSTRREPVQPAQEVGLDRRLGRPTGTPGRANGSGSFGIDLEHHPRVLGAEVVGVDAPEALRLEGGPHRDELRQVVAQRPQAVVDPGADRRIAAVEQMAAGEELQLRAVVVVGRVHRADRRRCRRRSRAGAATSR